MSRFPVQAHLRQIVEAYQAIGWIGGALIIALAPEFFFPVPAIANPFIAVMLARAAYCARAAWVLYRYQRGLCRSEWYSMSSAQIPVSPDRLFIGRGFQWTQAHTQRYFDVDNNPEFGKPSSLYEGVREFETRFKRTPVLGRIAAATSSRSVLNPLAPMPDTGGIPAIHAVGRLERERNIYIDESQRNGHLLVLGTTRVGKTRACDLMARQDIANGHTVIVIDPKGDGELLRNLYAEAIRCGRQDDFVLFHLGFPDISARYSPIANFQRITEVASRIALQLPGEGQSQAFREFVWRLVNVISQALVALGERPNYNLIKRYGEDIEPLVELYLTSYLEKVNHRDGRWKREVDLAVERASPPRSNGRSFQEQRGARAVALHTYFGEHKIEDFVALSLMKTLEYERGHLDKLVGSLLPLMEKLCTGKTGGLLSPDYLDTEDPRPIFDWPSAFRMKQIVYIGLDALTDPEVASAVGSSIFADLAATSGQIFKHGVSVGLPTKTPIGKVCIHADEFAELITDQFIPLMNKAGGAGIQVTAYSQTKSDVVAKLRSADKAGQVFGNFNNTLFLRVREDVTAELLTKKLKEVEVVKAMTLSSENDSSDPGSGISFTSSTGQRLSPRTVPLINPHELFSLPKGEAFGQLDGGKPFKIRMPLPRPIDLAGIPEDIQQIAAEMVSRYASNDSWNQYDSTYVPAAA